VDDRLIASHYQTAIVVLGNMRTSFLCTTNKRDNIVNCRASTSNASIDKTANLSSSKFKTSSMGTPAASHKSLRVLLLVRLVLFKILIVRSDNGAPLAKRFQSTIGCSFKRKRSSTSFSRRLRGVDDMHKEAWQHETFLL